MSSNTNTMTLAIAGLGTIGREVAKRIAAKSVPGLKLVAVAARQQEKAERNLAEINAEADIVPLGKLANVADVIIECTPAALFHDVASTAIAKGRTFIPLSVGQLLENMPLIEQARESGARIIVPTGALLGLDAVKAVAEGNVATVRMTTRKPPRGLAGAPHLVHNGISVEDLSEAKCVFTGSARDAAKGFPANVNVAAALALAGIGPDQTQVEIWADPGVKHNTHTISVTSDSSDFSMTIQNIPTEENPATGRITALSVVATLRRLTAPLVVGT